MKNRAQESVPVLFACLYLPADSHIARQNIQKSLVLSAS